MTKRNSIYMALSCLMLATLGGCESLNGTAVYVQGIPWGLQSIASVEPGENVVVRGDITQAGDDWFVLHDESGKITVQLAQPIRGTKLERWVFVTHRGDLKLAGLVEVRGTVDETGKTINAKSIFFPPDGERFFVRGK